MVDHVARLLKTTKPHRVRYSVGLFVVLVAWFSLAIAQTPSRIVRVAVPILLAESVNLRQGFFPDFFNRVTVNRDTLTPCIIENVPRNINVTDDFPVDVLNSRSVAETRCPLVEFDV